MLNENPLSSLVSIFNFLIDCGWNDHFDSSLLQPLSKVASTIDAVLLSHSDTRHLGALPYAVKQLGLSAPVFLLDRFNIRSPHYVQSVSFSPGKGEGIVIVPDAAGHLLRGTVWKITKDGEDVIYAFDYNCHKAKHLNGAVLESFV